MNFDLPTVNTVLLVITLCIAITALVYAIKTKNEVDDLDHHSASVKSNFSNPEVHEYFHGLSQNPSPSSVKVLDGYDANNTLNAPVFSGAYPSCSAGGSTNVPEPHHPHSSIQSSTPKAVHAASAYAPNYPNEMDPHSLPTKPNYVCSSGQDMGSVPPSSDNQFTLSASNLLPASWREGADSSQEDPNSLWAKNHPTKERYQRYITASGSARLGVITRSPMRKVVGQANLLRSGVSTPITAASISPWNDSSHRLHAIYDAHGAFPEDHSC